MNKEQRSKNKCFSFLFSLFSFFFVLCSLFIAAPLGAQELIAVHPPRGAPREMADIYFELLLQTIPQAQGGGYAAFPINLSRLPPDVPAGGFPPWVCPSPSVTGGAPYAITGEVAPDGLSPGSYRLRIYLWETANARLLGSDEMTARDRAAVEAYLPIFLNWALSWIGERAAPEQVVEYVYVESEAEVIVVETAAEPHEESWLYLGVRLGGGSSNWVYRKAEGQDKDAVDFVMNMNLAFQAAAQLTSLIAVQTEVNLTAEYNPEEEGASLYSYINIPLLFKLTFASPLMTTGIFSGVYLQQPLNTGGGGADYRAEFPGFVFGISAGWKLGQGGRLFLDSRYEHDGRWRSDPAPGEAYYRNSVKVNIGYEMGFFPKQR